MILMNLQQQSAIGAPARLVRQAVVLVASCTCLSSAAEPSDYIRWGDETLAMIERDFSIGEESQLAERVRRGDEPQRPAFAWPAGVQLSALAAAARTSPEHRGKLLRFIDGLDRYWIVHQGLGGYNAAADSPQPDRFYDDNAWIVLGLVEAYEATGEERLLSRAEEAMAFVLSGEDQELGGGVYWRENRRETKNTCSNAPTIVGALRLYSLTDAPRYLATAVRLYEWTLLKLHDDATGLFDDHVRSGGEVNRRHYTYNTGLMIRGACLLFEATGDERYLREAQQFARAAERRWVDPMTRVLAGNAKFAHLLLEALLTLNRVAQNPRWPAIAEATVTQLRGARDPATGRYPSRWSAQPQRRPSDTLIDQASAARAFYAVALEIKQRDNSLR